MINYLKCLFGKTEAKKKVKFNHRTYFDSITVHFLDLMRDQEEYDFETGAYSINASDGMVTIFCQEGKGWEGKRWFRSINQTLISSIDIEEAYRFVDEEIECEV